MTQVANWNLNVSKFKPQSRYYVHFQTNNVGKGMNPFIPSLLFFYKYSFGIK